MRVEARSVTEQRNILEKAERAARAEAETAMKEVNALRMRLSHLETQTGDLQTDLKNVSTQKNELEQSLDQIQDQLVVSKGKENQLSDSANEHQKRREQTQQILEETITRYQDTHHKETETMKAEIINKQQQLAQLKE